MGLGVQTAPARGGDFTEVSLATAAEPFVLRFQYLAHPLIQRLARQGQLPRVDAADCQSRPAVAGNQRHPHVPKVQPRFLVHQAGRGVELNAEERPNLPAVRRLILQARKDLPFKQLALVVLVVIPKMAGQPHKAIRPGGKSRVMIAARRFVAISKHAGKSGKRNRLDSVAL